MSILKDSFIQYIINFLKPKIEAKQDKLVSGENIKTINGTSILGSGNIAIDKADKLTNARTISLSGATVGSASFDGSKDVNINVDSIPQGYIQWAGKNSYETLSPLEATAPLFSTNRFALINPECVTIEYSQDGGNTWIKHPNDSSPSAKTYLFTPEVATMNLALGNKTSNQETTPLDMLRITIDGEVMNRYFRINTFLINMSNIGSSSPAICSYTRTTWRGDTINSQDYQVGGWPAWNTINLTNPIPFGNSNQTYVTKEISFTFKVQGNVVRPPMVCNIACIANTLYNTDEIYPKTGHLYKFDYLKNATFPARIDPNTTNAQDLGSTSKYWRNIYGNKFITNGGTNQQVVLGNGTLKALSEISPITDADAEILLDNHIHHINVNANGNDVNINVIESSKNGNAWETEDNDITIPLATTTSAGVMSKEDKAKLDDLSVIEIKYTLTEYEYSNHEIVNLYNIVYAISNRLYNNGWLYNDDKSYDVVVKGWVDNRYNAITYANFNVRLLTAQDGHSLGINGYVDVAQITETNENADCPLWVGYICGKYHIEDDGMAFYAPENPNFIVEA